MDNDYNIAMENLKNASEKLGKIHNSVSEMQIEMRYKASDFYYKLALLSGGVLSLSITYIGYLASVPTRQINYAELLFLGWFLLLTAVFSSIYRNHFNLDMGHHQTLNVLNNARLEEFRASLFVLENYPEYFINLKTQEEVDREIKTTKNNISMVEKGIKSVENEEKKNSFLWLASQKIAHISFFLGMVIITVFASLNLPIAINFTLINFAK